MRYDNNDLYHHCLDLQDEVDHDSKELMYLWDFLSWMDIWDDFIYFRTYAHLEQDEDDPFPRYVI